MQESERKAKKKAEAIRNRRKYAKRKVELQERRAKLVLQLGGQCAKCSRRQPPLQISIATGQTLDPLKFGWARVRKFEILAEAKQISLVCVSCGSGCPSQSGVSGHGEDTGSGFLDLDMKKELRIERENFDKLFDGIKE